MEFWIWINLLHILLISVVFIYIGLNGYFESSIQSVWFVLLFLIGIYGFLYHFYDTLDDDNPEVDRHDIANFLHMIVFAPIAIYVSYKGYLGFQNQVSKIWYVLIFLFGIWALVFHTNMMTNGDHEHNGEEHSQPKKEHSEHEHNNQEHGNKEHSY